MEHTVTSMYSCNNILHTDICRLPKKSNFKKKIGDNYVIAATQCPITFDELRPEIPEKLLAVARDY